MPQSNPQEPTGFPVPPAGPAPNPGAATPPPGMQAPVPPAGPVPTTGAPIPPAGPAQFMAPLPSLRPRVTRPAALIVGCVTVALSALVFGYHGVDQMFPMPSDLTEPFVAQRVLYALAHSIMALVSLAAALLIAFGVDLGRIIGAGLAGLLTWFFTGWLLQLTGDLIAGDEDNNYTLDDLGSPHMMATIFGGILGITSLILLSRRSLSVYAAEKRAPRPAAPQHPPVGLHTTPVVAEPPTGSVI